MSEDRNQSRFSKHAKKKLPIEWQPDLDPNHLAGENLPQQSDARVDAEWTAFHLRKRGLDLGGVNDERLKEQAEPGQE